MCEVFEYCNLWSCTSVLIVKLEFAEENAYQACFKKERISEEVGLEVNTQKLKYMFIFCLQNA
jgi:hypothetical protein